MNNVTDAAWRKASYSVHRTNCVEVAPVSGRIAVRDSKDPQGPVLQFSAEAWTAFTDSIKAS